MASRTAAMDWDLTLTLAQTGLGGSHERESISRAWELDSISCGGTRELHMPMHLSPGQYDLAAQLVPVADPAATDPDGSHEVPLSSAHVHAELLAPQDAHRWKLCDRGSRSPMCVERSESEQRVEAGVNNYFAESLGSEAWACLADSGEDACKAGGETCTVSDGQLRSCAEDGQLLLEMESEFLDWNEVAADGVEWRSFRHTELWPVNETALLLLDVWERHWCSAVDARVRRLVPEVNRAASAARALGIVVAHCPGEALVSLSSHPARRRVLDDLAKAGGTPPPLVRDGTLRVALLPENAPLEVPPPPLEHREAADGGCPSGEVVPTDGAHWGEWQVARDLKVDSARDAVLADDVHETVTWLAAQGVQRVLLAGFASNLCIVFRDTGLLTLLRSNFRAALLHDLTDPMLAPLARPYLPHGQAQRLHLAYLQRFVAPSVRAARSLLHPALAPDASAEEHHGRSGAETGEESRSARIRAWRGAHAVRAER